MSPPRLRGTSEKWRCLSRASTLCNSALTDIGWLLVDFSKLYTPDKISRISFCQRRKNTYWGSFLKRGSLLSHRDLMYSQWRSFTWQGWCSPNCPVGKRTGKHMTSRYFSRLSKASSLMFESLSAWCQIHLKACCLSFSLKGSNVTCTSFFHHCTASVTGNTRKLCLQVVNCGWSLNHHQVRQYWSPVWAATMAWFGTPHLGNDLNCDISPKMKCMKFCWDALPHLESWGFYWMAEDEHSSHTCFKGIICRYFGSVLSDNIWHTESVACSNNPILPVQVGLELFASHSAQRAGSMSCLMNGLQ